MKMSERRVSRITAKGATPCFLVAFAWAGCTSAPAAVPAPVPNQDSSSVDATDESTGTATGSDGDSYGEGTPSAPPASGADGAEDVPDDEPVDLDEPCAQEQAAAAQLIAERCGDCHGGGQREGGFGEALDPELMIARGLIVPGSLAGSEIYELTERGEMPLGRPDLSDAELGVLEAWILCEPEETAPDGDDLGGGFDDDEDDLADDDDLEEGLDDDDDDLDDDLDERADEQADADEDSDERAEEAAEDADDAAEEAAKS